MDFFDINEFRDGIFALRTRRFGSVAEIMIKALFGLEEATNLSYDKLDLQSKSKVEVKFSTVMKENDSTINDKNVIEQCLKANIANRAMSYNDICKYGFDCNIQQIKTDCFDILYYGLFFADRIIIYKMTNKEVLQCKGYSNKQHRNNEGEGQFHINNDTIGLHNQKYKISELSYKELLDLFKHI